MELVLVWILLSAALWKTVPGQIFGSGPLQTLYPVLSEAETVDCECGSLSCEQVAWFRTLQPSGEVQFLGRGNQADRFFIGDGFSGKFLLSKRGSTVYSLRILNVSTADRGVYSCVLKDRRNEELWKTGVRVRPGEIPPTAAPKPRATARPSSLCPCRRHRDSPDGVICGPLLLWPLVGLASVLCVTLLCTLYYYSRLPKKCRHHFVKRK